MPIVHCLRLGISSFSQFDITCFAIAVVLVLFIQTLLGILLYCKFGVILAHRLFLPTLSKGSLSHRHK